MKKMYPLLIIGIILGFVLTLLPKLYAADVEKTKIKEYSQSIIKSYDEVIDIIMEAKRKGVKKDELKKMARTYFSNHDGDDLWFQPLMEVVGPIVDVQEKPRVEFVQREMDNDILFTRPGSIQDIYRIGEGVSDFERYARSAGYDGGNIVQVGGTVGHWNFGVVIPYTGTMVLQTMNYEFKDDGADLKDFDAIATTSLVPSEVIVRLREGENGSMYLSNPGIAPPPLVGVTIPWFERDNTVQPEIVGIHGTGVTGTTQDPGEMGL